MKQRVIVELSGGVDSSTAASLLVKQGYDVIGISMKLFDSENSDFQGCCGIQGIEDARRVCQELSIPFYVLNLQNEFNDKVINYFCSEYIEGRTPNPCVVCNTEIKFGIMLEKAKKLDAYYLASGHYACKYYDTLKKRYILKKAYDKEKDQSYFLSQLTQTQLEHALFPLGEFTKEEVRNLAKNFNLPVFNKPASQEICFVANNNYKKFISNRIPASVNRGLIKDLSGKTLGEHQGIAFFTIGQRYGLGIAYVKPLYVIQIERENNTIIVGEEKDTYSSELVAKNVNWISIEKIDEPMKLKAQIRYRHKPKDAIVSKLSEERIKVTFDEPQKSITPGQIVVFYENDFVVGSGIIDSVVLNCLS